MSVGAPYLPAGALLAAGCTVNSHLHRGQDLDVYEVWSEERDCICVAKVLRPDRVCRPTARVRLRREGRLLTRLSHPHIVRAYAMIERPAPMVILEVLGGATLESIIQRQGRLPLAAIGHLGQHLCSAVGYLHRNRVLHLDLKPSNIVCECGRAKIIDLSIARRPGRGKPGVGSPPYMAPEQIRGAFLDEPTDVWGIGMVLHEAASGRRPFLAGGQRAPQDGLHRCLVLR